MLYKEVHNWWSVHVTMLGEVKTIMKNGYDGSTPLQIERPVYQIEELNRDHLYEKPYSTIKTKCQKVYKSIKPASCLKKTIPLLSWLPEYNWKRSFFGDIVSGITVAIMHIPQGMAYGLLGNVPPIVGIYMAFFPVLVYFIFGTSRHVSMGTFAIVCLMTGKVVSQHTTIEILQNGTYRQLEVAEGQPSYNNIQVAVTVTFTVAMIQIIYDSVLAIKDANTSAMTVSFIAVILLTLNNEIFKPWLSKKTKIPFPIELVAVVIGTTASHFMHFSTAYGITVVGRIPTGFPEPMLPAFELIPTIFAESFIITMVSYTITMSMALIFARKLMYEVDSNQELLALSLSNTVGSFFSCLPITASLSRSMIQQAVGGVTQLASIVSCGLLLIVLLWIGPCFEELPRCILASIIVVALKGMLLQCTAFIKFWKLSTWDGIVWIITFVTTLFVQISYGLAAGVAVSLLSIFIQGYKPYTCLLGIVPNTDLYLDIKRYKGAQEIEGIKIFHYSGGLSFASRNSFKELLVRKTDLDSAAILRRRVKLAERGIEEDGDDFLTRCILLDFSSVTFVDPAGVDFLRSLQEEYTRLNVSMYIAACSGPVYEVMKKCDKVEKKENKFVIFPTIHDAVLFAQANIFSKKDT